MLFNLLAIYPCTGNDWQLCQCRNRKSIRSNEKRNNNDAPIHKHSAKWKKIMHKLTWKWNVNFCFSFHEQMRADPIFVGHKLLDKWKRKINWIKCIASARTHTPLTVQQLLNHTCHLEEKTTIPFCLSFSISPFVLSLPLPLSLYLFCSSFKRPRLAQIFPHCQIQCTNWFINCVLFSDWMPNKLQNVVKRIEHLWHGLSTCVARARTSDQSRSHSTMLWIFCGST